MAKKVLVTHVSQFEAKLIERKDIKDPEALKSYDYNNPGDKWVMIEYLDGTRVWTPKYCLATPEIRDHSQITITVPK